MAKRQVFFSFHYAKDNWRAAQVKNMGVVDNSSTWSANDWEEVRNKSDSKIKEWIDSQMAMRSCIVVLIGEVICLLCECSGLSTASRCTKGDERKAHIFAPLLLCSEEVSYGTIADAFANLTFDIDVWRVAPCYLRSECPSVLH